MRWNGASHCELVGKSMESETTTWTEFPNGGKSIVEQILASEERNKSKGAGLWESQSGIQVRKLTIWVRSFEIKNYSRVHQVDQLHQSLWLTLKSPKTKTLEDGLIKSEAYLELFIFIVFKNINRVKINKIKTLPCVIFLLLLFSEKKVCIYVSNVLK